MTDKDCIIKQKNHIGDEQFLHENADDFVANALWCGKVSCQGLIAYTPTGLVERGYCQNQKREFSDANSHTFEDEVDQAAVDSLQESEPAQATLQVSSRTNIHQAAQDALRDVSDSGEDYDIYGFRDDLIGGMSMGVFRDPQIGRRR